MSSSKRRPKLSKLFRVTFIVDTSRLLMNTILPSYFCLKSKIKDFAPGTAVASSLFTHPFQLVELYVSDVSNNST